MTASYFLEKTKPKSAGEHAREEFLGLANIKQSPFHLMLLLSELCTHCNGGSTG